ARAEPHHGVRPARLGDPGADRLHAVRVPDAGRGDGRRQRDRRGQSRRLQAPPARGRVPAPAPGRPLEAVELSLSRPPSPIIRQDRKSTRLNSSHVKISYAVFCLKKKNTTRHPETPANAT